MQELSSSIPTTRIPTGKNLPKTKGLYGMKELNAGKT